MMDTDTFEQLVDLSAAQDVEAGDGTTSVVVLAGSLLGAAEKMLQKGIHPTIIAESFLRASAKAVEFLTEISTPIDLNDRTTLIRAASTSLNSKAGYECRFFLANLTHCVDCLSIFVHPSTYRRFRCHSPCHAHIHKRRFTRYPHRQESWRYYRRHRTYRRCCA
jgi:TCP-1/cpn60 chaperonin family